MIKHINCGKERLKSELTHIEAEWKVPWLTAMHLVMVVMMADGSYIVTSMHVVLDGGVERKTARADAMRTVIALLWPKCSESSDLSRRDFFFFFLLWRG
jgi:hypothetical protein